MGAHKRPTRDFRRDLRTPMQTKLNPQQKCNILHLGQQ